MNLSEPKYNNPNQHLLVSEYMICHYWSFCPLFWLEFGTAPCFFSSKQSSSTAIGLAWLASIMAATSMWIHYYKQMEKRHDLWETPIILEHKNWMSTANNHCAKTVPVAKQLIADSTKWWHTSLESKEASSWIARGAKQASDVKWQPHTMRARSRRTNWGEQMTGLAGEQLHARKGYMVER